MPKFVLAQCGLWDFKFIVYTKYTDLIIPYAEFFGKKLEIRKPIDRDSLLEILKHADFLVNIENLFFRETWHAN